MQAFAPHQGEGLTAAHPPCCRVSANPLQVMASDKVAARNSGMPDAIHRRKMVNQAHRARMHKLPRGARLKEMYSLSAADPRCLDGRPDRSWPPQFAHRGGQTVMPVLTHWPVNSVRPYPAASLSCTGATDACGPCVYACVCLQAWRLSWHGKPCIVHQALHPCHPLIRPLMAP